MDTLTAALTPHQQAMLLHHQQLLHEANVAEMQRRHPLGHDTCTTDRTAMPHALRRHSDSGLRPIRAPRGYTHRKAATPVMSTQRPIPVQYVALDGTKRTADAYDLDEIHDDTLYPGIDHLTLQPIALRLNERVWEQRPLTRH